MPSRASYLLDKPASVPMVNHCAGIMIRGLFGQDVIEPPTSRRLESLRKKCRDGNPFPLVAYQWPEFVVKDPAEAKYFQGQIENPEDPCLRLDPWQREIIAAFFDDTIVEIFIKGATKCGKGMSVSIGTNLWFDVWRECKVILTSADYEHACKNIYGEVRMWRDRMGEPGPGRIGAEGISDLPEHYVVVRNPLKDEGFSGQHGPRTLFVFDESSGVRDGLYENSQKQFRKIVSLSNPRTLFGWFRNGFKKCTDENKTQVVNGDFGRRLCVTVGGLDCLNVREKRLEKPIAPPGGVEIDGRKFEPGDTIPKEFFDKAKPLIPNQVDFGRYMGICQHADSRHIDVYAHGKFPTEDPQKQVILQSWMEFHEKAWSAASPPAVEAFGLDVARSLDGDSTCLAAGGQTGLRGTHKWKYADTTFHVAQVLAIAREQYGIDLTLGRVPVTVDMDGLGVGVGDQLRQKNVWVIDFKGNATSQVDPRTYVNLRAEAYATLGRRLNPDDRWHGIPWAIPASESLRQELCAPEKIYGTDGLRFGLTPKTRGPDREDIVTVKEKLGRSPDEADSVVYLWHAVRILFNLNELFQQVSAPLVMYPQPGDSSRELPGNGHAAAKENENLAWLRQQYGSLIGASPAPPDHVQEKIDRFKKESDKKAREAAEAAAKANGNGNGNGHAGKPAESWLDHVQWGDEK